MDKDNIQEGMIIYMRHLRFKDDGSIDSRMRGRPYLVYKIDEDKEIAYLFMIRSNTGGKPEELFFPVERKRRHVINGRIKRNVITTSYICLEDVYEMSFDEIVKKVREVQCDEHIKRQGGCGIIFPKTAMEDIAQKIKTICLVDKYKEKLKKVS